MQDTHFKSVLAISVAKIVSWYVSNIQSILDTHALPIKQKTKFVSETSNHFTRERTVISQKTEIYVDFSPEYLNQACPKSRPQLDLKIWIEYGPGQYCSRVGQFFFRFLPNSSHRCVMNSILRTILSVIYWAFYMLKNIRRRVVRIAQRVVRIAQSGKALSFRRRGPGFESRGQPYPQCFHPTLGMWTLVEGWSIGSEPAIDITHAPAGSDTLRGLVGKSVEWYFPAVGQGRKRGGKVVM